MFRKNEKTCIPIFIYIFWYTCYTYKNEEKKFTLIKNFICYINIIFKLKFIYKFIKLKIIIILTIMKNYIYMTEYFVYFFVLIVIEFDIHNKSYLILDISRIYNKNKIINILLAI